MNLVERNEQRYITVLISGGLDANGDPIIKDKQIIAASRGILHVRVGTSDDPARVQELAEIYEHLTRLLREGTPENPAVLVTTERVNIEFIQV